VTVKLTWFQRFLLAFSFAVTSLVAFSLMLIVMTFEIGILMAASLGLGLGTLACNSLFELPKLPENCQWTQKRGDYTPNPDPCCCAISITAQKKQKNTSKVRV